MAMNAAVGRLGGNLATRIGANVLSAWCLLNVIPGLGSLIFILLGKHAPALRMLFAADEIGALDGRALAATDGIAVLLNSIIVVYSGTAFFVVRRCLLTGQRWSFIVLAAGVSVLQVAGYVSDHFFQGKNILALNISSLILLVGFGLCAWGASKTDRPSSAP
jgi:hypothetical protein